MPKLFNPSSEDFTITYDINEDGKPLPFTLHAQEVEEIPVGAADNMVSKLAAHLVHLWGTTGSNYDAEYAKAKALIETGNL